MQRDSFRILALIVVAIGFNSNDRANRGGPSITDSAGVAIISNEADAWFDNPGPENSEQLSEYLRAAAIPTLSSTRPCVSALLQSGRNCVQRD